MSDATAVLRRGEGRLLRSGGLWIYDNEIDSITGTYDNGDIVSVRDHRGIFLGYGAINDMSRIRIRVLSLREDEPVSVELLRRRVWAAWDYRKHVMSEPADLSCCRIVFGEADMLPGITIDRFSDVLVIESLALGTDKYKRLICEGLLSVLAEDGIHIHMIYERSDARVRAHEGLPRQKGPLYTDTDGWLEPVPDDLASEILISSHPGADPVTRITENGIDFLVDVEEGQKTGFFLDQKYNRRAIRPMARAGRVLDCFTHTGAFALNAAAAGAREVWAVDASDTAIAQTIRNAELNGLSDRVRAMQADVFDLLPGLIDQGELFDLVILDPPAFTKSRASVKKAVQGYREINRRGMQLVRDGGYLVTCSCSHFMEPDLFRSTIEAASRDAHVRLRQVEYRTQAPDHPIPWTEGDGITTSYYLKLYILQVQRKR